MKLATSLAPVFLLAAVQLLAQGAPAAAAAPVAPAAKAAPAAAAPAAKASPAATADFPTLDKDKDGRVSVKESEVRGDLHDAFDALDQNHDGFLSASEFAKWTGAGNTKGTTPVDVTTIPSGSGNAQHMPKE